VLRASGPKCRIGGGLHWLASEGHLAVAPNLYHWGRRIRCLISTVRGRERPLSELDAARRWLAEHERCTGRTGVIGFCMGGDFALLMRC
jgi:carboxymethylenebutenolidase